MKNDPKEANFLKQSSYLIEKTLKSLGFETKIEEIYIELDYYEFCLQVAIGTNLSELEKHDRDLALALASVTGKVKMIIPIQVNLL